MRRRPVFFGVLLLLVVVIFGFLTWALNPSGPSAEAVTALQSDSAVTVESAPEWIVFSPTTHETQTALIFYPGGRVDYRSYAPMLREIAQHGTPVFLVRMPLSLAVLAPERAKDVIQDNPAIKQWVIGGHSLGGAMAANFVFQNPKAAAGLVLWAAYPAKNNSLHDQDLPVLSISASQDGLATPEKIVESRALLPSDTRWLVIEGGDHAQFGSYGAQAGDLPARISPAEQQDILVATTVRFLQDINQAMAGVSN